MVQALMYETHMHTVLCKHAQGSVEDYATVAMARNLRGMMVTCHNPLPNGHSPNIRMAIHEFDTYQEMVRRAEEAFRGRMEVHLGLECDYFPGIEPWLKQQLSQADFKYILGSVHPNFDATPPKPLTPEAKHFVARYYDHLVMAAQTGFFDTLSHPDIVKNMVVEDWQLEWVLPMVEPALDQIADTGVAMELNTSGLNKKIAEMNPGLEILKLMYQRRIPVVIGADAHEPWRVGDRFELALATLKEVGYRQVHWVLGRQRQAIDIDLAMASLVPMPSNAK